MCIYIYIYICVTVIPIMIIKTSAKKECDHCAKPIGEVAFGSRQSLLWKVTIQISKSSENHSDIPANQRRFYYTNALLHAIKNICWLSETEKVYIMDTSHGNEDESWQAWEICCVSPSVQTPFSESFRRSLIDYTTPLRQKFVDLPVFSDGEDSWIQCGYFVPVFL